MFSLLSRLLRTPSISAPSATQHPTLPESACELSMSPEFPPRHVFGPEYQPELTERLKVGHRILLGLHGAALNAAYTRNFPELEIELDDLVLELNHHFATEQRVLCAFDKLCKDDSSGRQSESVRDLKHEMYCMTAHITDLMGRYAGGQVDDRNVARMIADFEALGDLLSHHLVNEEALLFPICKRVEQDCETVH